MLLVSDYDNTYEMHFGNKDLKKIFELNYKAIKKFRKSNNLFAIATGRHFDAIKKTIDEKQLEFDYLIANNGAEVYDKNCNLLFSISIDDESLAKIKMLGQLDIYYRSPHKSEKITSINIYFSRIRTFEKVRGYIETNLDNCAVEYKYPKIKIVNKVCNKVIGIQVIQKIESLNSDDIYTIGDDMNDLNMIKEYNGYSLLEAKPEVQRCALKNYERLEELINYLNNINYNKKM